MGGVSQGQTHCRINAEAQVSRGALAQCEECQQKERVEWRGEERRGEESARESGYK